MSDISDPGGAGRGDRRRARKTVDGAYAEGRITSADRALRMQQIEAASTKGDLAMVVRDLGGAAPVQRQTPAPPVPPMPFPPQGRPGQPPAGTPPAAPPQTFAAARDQARERLQSAGVPFPQVTATRSSSNPLKIVLVVVALLVALPCVFGVIGLVSSFSSSDRDRPRFTTSPSAAAELVDGTAFEPATWRRFVADLKDEYGDDVELWSMFAYPDRYSGYVVVEGDLSQFVTWSDGRLGNTLEPRDNVGDTDPIAIDDIDPAVFRKVAQAAVDEVGSSTLRSLYVYIKPTSFDDTFYRGTASREGSSESVSFDKDGDRINR